MTDHPINPSTELVQHWIDQSIHAINRYRSIATLAAQWGADQELKACCSFLEKEYPFQFEAKRECTLASDDLRAARRPKPPSLKEQALAALNEADQGLNESEWRSRSNTIRRALEALPDD